jgi:hypothetical protein
MQQNSPHLIDIDNNIETNIINKLETSITIRLNDLNTEIKFLGSYCIISIGLIMFLYIKVYS